MKIVSLLIKPVSGACNLRCRYCFYHELESRGGVPGGRCMTYRAWSRSRPWSGGCGERKRSGKPFCAGAAQISPKAGARAARFCVKAQEM